MPIFFATYGDGPAWDARSRIHDCAVLSFRKSLMGKLYAIILEGSGVFEIEARRLVFQRWGSPDTLDTRHGYETTLHPAYRRNTD